jgi:hypothetical protein
MTVRRTFPTVEQVCQASATAGFRQEALERVPQTNMASLAELLRQADIFRHALRHAGKATSPEPTTS